jgi:hypothetical protein
MRTAHRSQENHSSVLRDRLDILFPVVRADEVDDDVYALAIYIPTHLIASKNQKRDLIETNQ